MTRKQLMQLNVENKIRRSSCGPSLHHSDIRYRVKGGIDLHHVEMLRVPSQTLTGWHPLGVPAFDKSRVGPACRADQDFAFARHQRSLSVRVRISHPSLFCFFFVFSTAIFGFKTRGGAAW